VCGGHTKRAARSRENNGRERRESVRDERELEVEDASSKRDKREREREREMDGWMDW